MAKCVCSGAKISCSFGSGPKSMLVLPLNRTLTANTKPIANILDIIPFVNIPAFGNCLSPAQSNELENGRTCPRFYSVFLHSHTVSPWSPGAKKTKIGQQPVVLANSKTMCAWAGSISVVNPGQVKIDCN